MLVRCNSAKLHRLLDPPLRDILIARCYFLPAEVHRIKMGVEGHLKENQTPVQTMQMSGGMTKQEQTKQNKQTNKLKEGTISGM